MRGDDPSERHASRRSFLLSSGALGIAALAGCTDGGDGEEGGQGAEEAGAGLGGDGDGGNGNEGGEPGDEMLSDSFDPAGPDWENNNYLGGLIPENDYIRGTEHDLEEMAGRGREEAVYGSDPWEHPDDESEWIDPDPIVYAELPREDSEAAYQETLEPMVERLEETTGRRVEFQSIDSYAAVVEGMRSERIHIANYATGNTPFGVNIAGAVPFAVGHEADGQFGYRLLAGTRADMDEIQSVEDFVDHRVAHTESSSNSGHQAPS
ncbi:MAG: PhnD/SsuA/transferrin family substrate-binding protein, partial [Halalkalicoccus sp.]